VANGLGKPRRPSFADPSTCAEKHDCKRNLFGPAEGGVGFTRC